MLESEPEPVIDGTTLTRELLHFYDDFVEFQDHCSFLCDAIASLVGQDEQLDPDTIMGIKRFCYWVKDRGQDLKKELKQIQGSPRKRTQHPIQ